MGTSSFAVMEVHTLKQVYQESHVLKITIWYISYLDKHRELFRLVIEEVGVVSEYVTIGGLGAQGKSYDVAPIKDESNRKSSVTQATPLGRVTRYLHRLAPTALVITPRMFLYFLAHLRLLAHAPLSVTVSGAGRKYCQG